MLVKEAKPSQDRLMGEEIDTSDVFTSRLVIPGQYLCSAEATLRYEDLQRCHHCLCRGHGTSERDGEVRATLSGIAEAVNKLVLVRPIGNTKYVPECGDVVVGRIIEVGTDRWFVDIKSHQRGQLQLSSTHLLSGEQRRRTTTDQLDMRKLYQENDVVCLEVQRVSNDGQAQLHARNARYGTLRNGSLTVVAPPLVQRQPNHMFTLEKWDVHIVLGINGLIWTGLPPEESKDDTLNFVVTRSRDAVVPQAIRERIARVKNIVAALASHYIPITGQLIDKLCTETIDKNIAARDLLDAEVQASLCQPLLARAAALDV